MTDNLEELERRDVPQAPEPMACPLCDVPLVKSGGPIDWEWQHDSIEGEGCLLEFSVNLQDADDIAAWNHRPATAREVEGLRAEVERLKTENEAAGRNVFRLQTGGMKLAEALRNLETAEAEYRKAHDLHGDGSPQAGRAWDLMRRAGDAARAALGEAK